MFVVALLKRDTFALVAIQLFPFITVNTQQFDVFLFLALEADILVFFLFDIVEYVIFVTGQHHWPFLVCCHLHAVDQAGLAEEYFALGVEVILTWLLLGTLHAGGSSGDLVIVVSAYLDKLVILRAGQITVNI